MAYFSKVISFFKYYITSKHSNGYNWLKGHKQGIMQVFGLLRFNITISNIFWYNKKRLVSRINPSLLLKIILYNTWTLQQIKA